MKMIKSRLSIIAAAFFLIISYEYAEAGISYPIYAAPDRSITALTDVSGSAVNIYVYDAFGNVTSSTSSISNNYAYVGEAKDAETGLIFLRHRYFDPAIGRFITKDPLLGQKSATQSLNSYVYCANNPVTWLDPLGLATLYYWQGHGRSMKERGWCSHVAIMLNDGTYISNWPAQQVNALTMLIPFYTSSRQADFGWDSRDESGNPLHTITINTLNEAAMKEWWSSSRKDFSVWYDCSDTFARALREGGINMPHHFIYTPEAVWGDINKQIKKSKSTGSRSRRLNDKNRKRDNYYAGGPWDDGGGGGGGGLNTGSGSYYRSYMYGYYGGVSLSKTADLMLNIQDIDGAGYDEATGQMILYGKHNTSLPNMELDDLAVAVRSVYGVSKPAEDPGISIDAPAIMEEGQPQPVRYIGDTSNTKFGWVMFESDRLMEIKPVVKYWKTVNFNYSGDKITGIECVSGRSVAYYAYNANNGYLARLYSYETIIKTTVGSSGYTCRGVISACSKEDLEIVTIDS